MGCDRRATSKQLPICGSCLARFFTFLVFTVHSISFGGYRKPLSFFQNVPLALAWSCPSSPLLFLYLCFFSGLFFFSSSLNLYLPQNKLGASSVSFSPRFPSLVTTLRCIVMQLNELSTWSFLAATNPNLLRVTLNFEIYPPSQPTP